MSLRAILTSVLFKNKFQYSNRALPPNLKPLMTVVFNNERTKTYFGENIDNSLSASWGNGDVFSTMSDFNLNFFDINLSDMFKQMTDADGTVMFDTRIMEDCHINNLLDKLIEPHKDKWEQFIPLIKSKNVSLDYSDRYLSTPLGCMLLAHFIRELQQRLDVTITNICISVKALYEDNVDIHETNINNDYKCNKTRNKFLKDAISELVGITPLINDNGYIEHERCMTVKSVDAELCIRPDAGIAHGWVPFGHDFSECTDEDLRYNWDLNIRLYNKKQNFSGILYTISFDKHTSKR